jgi:hypothetical protein
MKHTVLTLASLSILIVVPACEREGPPRPVGSATNKHFEESRTSPADRTTGAIKSPLDEARQAEGVLQGASETRSKQSE